MPPNDLFEQSCANAEKPGYQNRSHRLQDCISLRVPNRINEYKKEYGIISYCFVRLSK